MVILARWNPIPSALSHEKPTKVADPPLAKNPKTNGYIFRQNVDGSPGETRYFPKICRCLPAYPRTYGLSCPREDCQHCHPRTAVNFPHPYAKPSGLRIRSKAYLYSYGAWIFHTPRRGSCLTGRRGTKFNKMISLRPAKNEVVAKDETRRQAARTERVLEEGRDEEKRDKTQRLSKWETSPSRPIDEGRELAMSEDVVLPTDDWKTEETGDIQLAILASLGLLDDYEAEDANITLNSLPRNEDLYTIKYKPGRKKSSIGSGPQEADVPILDYDVDWELVMGSPSEGSMSWTMIDE